ncbi:conserved membrane hypothetical protein [Enterobacterales bacterium 8AC]|nr:conserved membrane hypothetical protein [Enterobacterales bacterium 8AC]
MALVIKYFIIAFTLALTVVLINVFGKSGEIRSLWHGVEMVFWATLGPGAGMTLGAVLRLWLMPDAIITQGGMSDMMKARLFWLIGPQCIGGFVGLMVVHRQLM